MICDIIACMVAKKGKDFNRLHELEESLYSRNNRYKEKPERSEISKGEKDELPDNWELPEEDMTKRKNKKHSFLWTILIFSIGFFVVSVGIAAFAIFGGTFFVSSENVDISVVGPVSINGGEELSLDVVIGNENKVGLTDATLFVEYPEGARKPDNIQEELVRETYNVGAVSAGSIARKTVKAVLFGEKGAVQNIHLKLEYGVESSNAVVVKEKDYEILIDSSPINVTLDYPSEVNPNQDLELEALITSNSNNVIDNVLLIAEYPFGFSFESANPEPNFDDTIWNIGTLEPEESKTVTINGKLFGQDRDERTFRIKTGVQSEQDQKKLGAIFSSIAETIEIKESLLSLDIKVSEQSQNYSVSTGENVKVELIWQNNTEDKITNARIETKLGGNMFDKNNVVVGDNGFFRSLSNTIIWDQNSYSDLREILPGESGVVIFQLRPKSENVSRLQDPLISLDVILEGSRFQQDGSPIVIRNERMEDIKIVSQANLYSRIVYSTGPFINTGPFPPEAETPTTYTAIWSVTNMFNDITGAKVVATLPPYVTWLQQVSPSNEDVKYDEETRTITWNIGEVLAEGLSVSEQVAFQVELLPSVSQVGTVPVIVDNATFQGIDRFTGSTVKSVSQALTTKAGTDPLFISGYETVRQ